MRILVSLFSFMFFSLSAFGSENFQCTNNNFQLAIRVTKESEQKYVTWGVKLIGEEVYRIEGRGNWHKEEDSSDAFSSFDANSAISYKNQRAVFVFSNNQAILFPSCTGFSL